MTNLQAIVTDPGNGNWTPDGIRRRHVEEGVAQGMTEAGWSSDAETVAANLQAALNAALGTQSPSTRMKPTGSNVAAGVGAGMGEHDFTGEAASLAGRLSSAVSAAMPAKPVAPRRAQRHARPDGGHPCRAQRRDLPPCAPPPGPP